MDKTFKIKLSLERGRRIKIARSLSGLTRKEMFERYNINPNTVRAWEKGANLLTDKKASTLVSIFNQEGINITTEWLLYGEDPGFVNKSGLTDKNQDLKDVLNIRGDLKILDEVNYFLDNNFNSISSMITDGSLFPFFCVGDYVGGIKVAGKNLMELVGAFSIITTDDERVVVKKIFTHKEKNIFLVGNINPYANLNEPDYFSCTIRSAAKITRQWHVGMASKRSQTEDV
jgi:transcriptional regulator with XRE-family HTH domain